MRQSRLILFLLVCLFLGGLWTPQVILAQTPLVSESDQAGLRLAWSPPAYSQTIIELNGQSYSRFQMAGATLSGQPGGPQLPLYSGLIGLPPTGSAHLRLIEVERELLPLSYPPFPAPLHTAIDRPEAISRVPDPAIYQANAFYPATIAELGPVQQVGRQRVARLTIYPLRVNPVAGQLERIRSIRLEVTFDEPSTGSLSRAETSTPLAQAVAATLLNPEAAAWSAAPPSPSGLSQAAADPALKVVVNEPGLYALSYQALQQAGLPVDSVDPRTFQLFHQFPRQEAAIRVEGEADGRFDPGDRILFYTEAEFSRFVDTYVYFLQFGQASGRRMAYAEANPASLPPGTAWRTATFETNQYYDPHYPGRDGDYWYWDDLSRADKTAADYSFSLEAPLTAGPDATLTIWLRGYTDPWTSPNHRALITLNGVQVGDHTWSGTGAVEVQLPVAAAILREGSNQLGLSLPGLDGVTIEGMWLDAFALTYPTQSRGGSAQLAFWGEAGSKAYALSGWSTPDVSLYEITDPDSPRYLGGYTIASDWLTMGDVDTGPNRYLAVLNSQIKTPLSIGWATALTDPPNGADYIIITHPDFSGAIAPLAAHRVAGGLRVATVETPAIYDTFGDGRLDPAAIKNFLQHAYTTWSAPAPTYVLLVGDGTYDFKDYSGYHPQTFLPPYLAHVDPWWGETAADNRFVTLSGDDRLPDMLIGRLPVNTAAETDTVVDKIIRYETDPPAGFWDVRQLFVADNPDSAGDFHADANRAYQQIPQPLNGHRFYYSPASASSSYIYTDPERLRADFLNQFNFGAGLVTFYGHSSWTQWAVEGLFRYHWEQDPALNDLMSLSNSYRLPVMLEMTCFTASFHRPESQTIDESLLRLPGGGAVAVWGSSGLGVSTGHAALQSGFYQAVFEPGGSSLGAATLAGKMKLYSTGFHQDLLDTFLLLGDPALPITFEDTPTDLTYLPLISR